MFGAHQLVETFVWWQLQGHVRDTVGTVAMWAYLLIALVVLPPSVPLAIRAIEPTAAHRALVVPFMVIGGAVAATLLTTMLGHAVTATMSTHHVVYHVAVPYPAVLFPAYVVATCGSLLVSGYRHTVLFGALNLPVVILLAMAERNGLASLWCAWAAVTSVMIAAHLRHPPLDRRVAPGRHDPVTRHELSFDSGRIGPVSKDSSTEPPSELTRRG